MKKLLLSLGVILGFASYSLTQEKQAQSQTLVATNTPPANTTHMGNSGNRMMMSPRGKYKDGEYVGDVADAYYGNIQVKAVIANGQISDVQFLQYPNDRRTSIMINSQAMPLLKQEAISVQSAKVDIISGATDSSQAFIQSMDSALANAI